jgi:hypothetical protein
MFDLLKMDVAVFLVLAWIFTGLFLPVIALWFLVRVTRDLRRIADATDQQTVLAARFASGQDKAIETALDEVGRRVVNSAFGR